MLLDALPDDSPFRQLDPAQRRQRTLTALKRVFCAKARSSLCSWCFEDLHWIDTETQALLDSLVESLPTAQLLLLVNYRPEYQHSWGSKTYYTQLRLDPLAPASAATVLQALLGDDLSLAPLTPLLIARTAGNPFFLEESVRTLVETGGLVGETGAYRLAQPLHSIQVPATVQAVWRPASTGCRQKPSACCRPPRSLARRCSLPLLVAIADLPDTELYRHLSTLQAAEFLYETRLFPELEYTFKHALTHEVAYGSLLHERRRALHARTVEALEGLAGDRVAEQVERLAHHALRGEVWEKALGYCRQVGEKALARSAHREAVGYFEQALSALSQLPEQHATREQAVDLRLALRTALMPSGDFGRILAALREAESLAAALDDPRRLGQVSVVLSRYFYTMGVYDQAIAAAQRALALATAEQGCRSARAGEPVPRPGLPCPGGLSSGDRLLRADCGVPRRGAPPRAFRPGLPTCRAMPDQTRLRAMPSWARSPRAGPSGKKDCGLPRRLITPRVSCVPIGGSVCCPSIKATCPGHSPCLNGPWASVRTRTSPPISPGSLQPWVRRILWAGASPTPCRCSRRRWNGQLQRK